ncbi:MAG: AAA family ATPase [Clostridiales bacterium]|nr:AAA family ATPase [Clostridiales bacterium]
MKQAKKIFTRMLINNWGGISHRMLEFHEYVNLFSGKSGSGKSTVMDAIQVVLYGSLSASFLNKAADDAKNRRSVLSYLRGAQKDGSANRGNQDFYAQIVLELMDTGTHIVTCFGVAFEVGRTDTDVRKYTFFSHSGRMPEDEYLSGDRVPYSIAQIRKLTEERSRSMDNRGRGDVNRIYPSKEAYINTLYDVILGYVEPQRLMTMEKSAIALRMTNGTGQFIRDYMFPKSQENAIEKISDQLGAYREIKERVEDLEHRIGILQRIHEDHGELQKTRADIVHGEAILKYIEIESNRVRLEAREQDLREILSHISRIEEEKGRQETEQKQRTEELIEVEADLKASDYGQKKRELLEVQNTIELLAGNSRQWRQILQGLRQWEEDQVITDYVSNPVLHMLEDFQKGRITEEGCRELRRQLAKVREDIDKELQDLNAARRELSAELEEKREIVEDLKHDRKPYDKELRKAQSMLQSLLRNLYEGNVEVHIFADLFDIVDEEWKNAVEGRMGRIKYSLIVAPEYALKAAELFRRMKQFEDINLINTAAIKRDRPEAREGSLYEAVHAEEAYVDLCLRQYLGRVMKCRSVEELHQVHDGVTPDCYAYSGYMFRHLKEKDYTLRACIGTRVSKDKLRELEEEVAGLSRDLHEMIVTGDSLKAVQQFEMLNQEPSHLMMLSQSAVQLEEYYKKQEALEQALRELEDGTLIAGLKEQQKKLSAVIRELNTSIAALQGQMIQRTEDKGKAESEIHARRESLERLLEGFVQNPQLEEEVKAALEKQSENGYRNQKNRELETLRELEEAQQENRFKARMQFNREYPSYGFSGMEKENDAYDGVLEKCRKDFEPQYKEEFRKQCDQVYESLRENVIAAIHGEIKAAYRHAREINRLLSRIRFSDSVYQIEILPAENENGQFYEMLMAKELDSKVVDNHGFEGQMSLGEDEFYRKYEQKIQLLTEKFMPPREDDSRQITLRRQEMERYADYRNYLTFSMYERVEDENGSIRKNPVDEMAGRDSGGEGQNPKYVALLAGFAMLYMQQSNRDSKMRLVLLDEAFSKMDKERSEVCLRYARELELQLIVCVPDERLQSLIRNVDCVYGFRRHMNQITMMHINKGNYLEMLEGREDGSEEEDTDTSAVADTKA